MKKSRYKETLKDAGLKSTPARLAVLELLEKSDSPLDVSEVHTQLIKKGIRKNPVTTYRILDKLTFENLVKKVEFHEGKFRYEKSGADHHHLVCEKCGTVFDVINCPVEPMVKMIYKTEHFLVKHHALEFFGLCKNCF